MKHFIIAIIMSLTITEQVIAQVDSAFYRIRIEMEKLKETDNMFVKNKGNTKMKGVHFKYILNEEEMSIKDFMPSSLQRISEAFDKTLPYSTESMQRNSGNIDALPLKPLAFSRPDSYFGSVIWSFHRKYNYKYTCLQMNDTLCNRYLLLWKNTKFTDSDSKPFACIDGYILEIEGNNWRRIEQSNTYNPYDESLYANYDRSIDNDTTEYVKLREKLRQLHLNFETQKRRNNAQHMSGIAYMTKQLCEKFDKRLTEEQYHQTSQYIKKMSAQETNAARKRFFHDANTILGSKVDVDLREGPTNVIRSISYYNIFTKEEKSKNIIERFNDKGNQKSNNTNWILTGNIAPGFPFITIDVLPPSGFSYKYRYDNEEIDFRKDLHYSSIVEISDGTGGNQWALIVDSLPVRIDMKTGNITASEMNRKFIGYQKQIKAFMKDIDKYITNVSGDNIIMDEEGYEAATERIEQFYYDIIKENRGNSIAKYYLFYNYPGMSMAQLDTIMQDSAYRNDILTMPACTYYDGKRLRQPGRMYTDLTLEDRDGNKHRLSDYVGKSRYVLVHTWSVNSWWSRRNMFANKNISKKYDDSDIKVIGVSPYNDKEWKEYTEKRNMNWLMLADNGGWDCNFMKVYGITSMPETFIIDAEGRIVAEGLHGKSLEKKVEELMKRIRD